MTPAAKSQREDQLRQMEARNRQRAQDLDQQMQAREQELTAPIMQRVNGVIEGVRAEFNYAFIFDVAAANGPIVTADRSLDITNLVIQRLQAAGPAPAPAPSANPQAAVPADTSRAPAARPAATPAGPRVRPRP
jgi:outer membrane protein